MSLYLWAFWIHGFSLDVVGRYPSQSIFVVVAHPLVSIHDLPILVSVAVAAAVILVEQSLFAI
jgi:hypothetical protein